MSWQLAWVEVGIKIGLSWELAWVEVGTKIGMIIGSLPGLRWAQI